MRTRKKSIPAGILFLAMSAFALNVYYERKQAEYKISRKFLGDYKLIYLDHKKCDNCKVRLKEDYTYDIFIKDKVVGHGKWQSETAIDIPGPFLEIENGPGSVIWEKDRLIEYINRTQN